MSLEPIIIEYLANDARFQAISDKVQERLEQVEGVTKRLSKRLDEIGDSLTRAGKKMSVYGAAVGAAAGGAFMLASRTADAGDRVAKASRQAGVGAEYWQEYAYSIGQVTDITEEELNASMTRLTKLIGEAADGSKGATEALEKLGFSNAQIADGMIKTEAAFDAFVRAADSAKSPAEAAALAADLFGKSGAALGTQLVGAGQEVKRLRDEAQDLGLVMSGKTTANAEKFNDSMDRVKSKLDALWREVGEKLLPIFNEQLIPAFENGVIPVLEKLVGWVGDVVTAFGELSPGVQEAIAYLVTGFTLGGPVLVALGYFSKAVSTLIAATGPVGLFIGAAGLLFVAWQKWGDEIQALLGPPLKWIGEKFDAILGVIDRMVEGLKTFGTRAAEAINAGDEMALPGSGVADAFSGDGAMWRGMDENGGLGGGGSAGGQSMGRNLIAGMLDGMDAALEEHRPRLDAIAAMVPEIFRESLGIRSPSTVMAEIGTQIGQGLAQGLESASGMVAAATRVLTDAVPKEIGEAVSSILGSMSTLFSKSKGFAIAQALVNIGLGMSEALKLPFPANIKAMFATAAAGAQAMSTIRSASPGGGGQISGGGGAAAAAAAAAPRPALVTVQAQGPMADMFNGFIGTLAEQLRKDFGDSGYVLASATR